MRGLPQRSRMSDFFKWLEQSQEDRSVSSRQEAEYGELKKVWQASVPQDLPQSTDPETMWAHLQRSMDEVAEEPVSRGLLVPAWSLWLVSALAVVLVLWFGFFRDRGAEFAASPGQRVTLQLKDGSAVELNADSTLAYERGFNRSHRSVNLMGEAFFDVKKGAFPFEIATENAVVKVVGTQFNVSDRDDHLEVGVVEGVVQVSVLVDGADHHLTLRQGESVTMTVGSPPSAIKAIAGSHYPPWKNDKIFCEQTPLIEVCREISRRFAVDIRIDDPAMETLPVDGLLEASNLEATLMALSLLVGKEVQRENGAYVIR